MKVQQYNVLTFMISNSENVKLDSWGPDSHGPDNDDDCLLEENKDGGEGNLKENVRCSSRVAVVNYTQVCGSRRTAN